MRDYKNGKIYKIVSYKTGRVYIGSTIQQLSSRMAGHRRNYNKYQGRKKHTLEAGTGLNCITPFDVIHMGDADIVLVETYPCNSKDELDARGRYWLEKSYSNKQT